MKVIYFNKKIDNTIEIFYVVCSYNHRFRYYMATTHRLNGTIIIASTEFKISYILLY